MEDEHNQTNRRCDSCSLYAIPKLPFTPAHKTIHACISCLLFHFDEKYIMVATGSSWVLHLRNQLTKRYGQG